MDVDKNKITQRNYKKIKNMKQFSIIIPVFNEMHIINSIIEHLYTLKGEEDFEIIVVDGNSERKTIKTINDERIIAITSEKGRAKQMNTGADIAKGKILVFVHADTKLPENALKKISKILKKDNYIGGAFDLEIDSNNLILKFISYTASIKAKFTKVPYGDQVIFIRKDYFNKIGRYKEISLMEDVELMQRIKREGGKIFIIKDKVKTSPRKWIENGIIYNTLKNNIIRLLYYFGVSTEKLAKFYYN